MPRRTALHKTTPYSASIQSASSLHAEHGLPEGFPFAPDSAIRKFAEPITLIMITVIAGMDVAHPSIGAGVDRHSDFQEKPLRRVLITGDALIRLVFGDTDEALTVAKHIRHVHAHVQGRHSAKDGQTHAGASYYANDGELQRWVLATGFYGIETAHKRWLRPLSPKERQDLYQDMVTFGQFFGIPKELIPTDVHEHDKYMEAMLESNLLGSTVSSQKMVRRVFGFRHWSLLPPTAQFIQAVSRTSLDPRFQEKFGIYPTKRDRILAAVFDKVIRGTYPYIPGRLRRGVVPTYLTARRLGTRIARVRQTI